MTAWFDVHGGITLTLGVRALTLGVRALTRGVRALTRGMRALTLGSASPNPGQRLLGSMHCVQYRYVRTWYRYSVTNTIYDSTVVYILFSYKYSIYLGALPK